MQLLQKAQEQIVKLQFLYTDQTVIHLFYDNDTSLYDQSGNLLRDSSTVYTGKVIGEYSYGNHHEIDGGYLTVNTILSGHVNNEHYYLYARIDDGINPPVYSKYTTPIFSSPPVHGEISLSTPEGRNFLQNYLVYLDINNNGRFDPMENEPHEYTNNNGLYAFHGIDSGEYRMDIFLHHGYKISIDSPTQLPLIVNYELGASLEFNFQIQDIDERW